MGGFLLGVDTSIIGRVTIMPSYLSYFGETSASVHGLIVSSILLSASFVSFIAGRPADAFGRPQGIALGVSVFGVGVALQAGAVKLAMLIFMVCTGLAAGYFICYGTQRIEGSLSWRTPFIVLTVLAIIFVVLVLIFLPPSPRWLHLHGKHAEAEATWEKLGVAMKDRASIEEEDVEEAAIEKKDSSSDTSATPTGKKKAARQEEAGFFELFSEDVRGRTFLAVFLMGFLQLSGIDAVLYYAPLLFQQAGLTSTNASFFASGVSGIVLVVISVPALLFADKWGRRTCTLVGGTGLTINILLIGALYASGAVYAPEIQPQRTRAKATVLAHGFNWVCNWFVAFICPILLSKSNFAPYFLFGGCCALTTVVCFFFMIETKGKSLDEIERAFQKKAADKNEAVGVKVGTAFKRVFGSKNKRHESGVSSTVEAAEEKSQVEYA
ncbi:MAG: hypothetical protein M1821_005818 [Bathelium mastoideum]|nr:MAG: hypothetical protein M1821_005818 [Bathelium mastoideum]